MWFQQPDAFTHVQFHLKCGPDHLLKWFKRSDLYYKTHEVTRCNSLYIFLILFFIKWSCLVDLFNTQKSDTEVAYRKNCAGIGSDQNWPILWIFWIGSEKWYRCILIDFRPGLSWSMAQSIFSSSKWQHANNAPEHTSFFRPARPWTDKWAQMHLLFKQRGAGRENENCVGLKLAKTLVPRIAPGVW